MSRLWPAAAAACFCGRSRGRRPRPSRRRPSATAPEETISNCWPRSAMRAASAVRAFSQARSGSPVSPIGHQGRADLDHHPAGGFQQVRRVAHTGRHSRAGLSSPLAARPSAVRRAAHLGEGGAQEGLHPFAGDARDRMDLVPAGGFERLGAGLAGFRVQGVDLVERRSARPCRPGPRHRRQARRARCARRRRRPPGSRRPDGSARRCAQHGRGSARPGPRPPKRLRSGRECRR